jgi:hypothetical protein
MATLDDIVNQSFQEEQNRFNNKKIKTGESNKVAKLFEEVQAIKTDCNICYNNSIECIQCYQCDFKYCQECLTKIISEFNRCSACSANFKDNYSQLKDKNKKIPVSASSSKNTKTSRYNDTYITASNEDLLSDYEIEQIAILLKIENFHLEPNNKSTNKKNNTKNTKNTQAFNNANEYGYLDNEFNNGFDNGVNNGFNNGYLDNEFNNGFNNKFNNGYLDNEFDNEIESCQFQIIKQTGRYIFNVQLNTDSNEIIYTANVDNLHPIILNYKLLDKCFQRTVFLCLLELIYKPNIFPNVWQTMGGMIYNFTYCYSYLIHSKNHKNQGFLYQKQDLINTINQMSSY